MQEHSTRTSLSTGTIVRFLGLTVLVLILYKLFDVLIVVLAAVVIASSVEPVVRRMKHIGMHRIVSVVIIYLLVAGLLSALLIFFVPHVIRDTADFLRALPDNLSLSGQTISVADFVNSLQDLVVGNSAGAFKTATIFFGGALSFLLIVVLSFYLAVQEDGVDDFLRIIAPVKKHDYILNLWKRSQRKIGFWLQGQILLGIIVGVLVYIVLMVVGIPYALALAVFAALFEIIPVFGPIISSVPAILIAFADRGVATGLLLIGLYIIIYQFESQLFYPLVVQKIVGVNPIIVILALVIGANLAGLLGALIAVPLSAALMEYIGDIDKRKKAERSSYDLR